MNSTTPCDPKAYYQTYYLKVSKINCVCEDCFKTFATLQTLRRHQRTNQKCLIIKLKQQLQEKEEKAGMHSRSSESTTAYEISSPSDMELEHEPELKSYSVFNYVMWCHRRPEQAAAAATRPSVLLDTGVGTVVGSGVGAVEKIGAGLKACWRRSWPGN